MNGLNVAHLPPVAAVANPVERLADRPDCDMASARRLATRRRAIVVMYELEGLVIPAIATVLGIIAM